MGPTRRLINSARVVTRPLSGLSYQCLSKPSLHTSLQLVLDENLTIAALLVFPPRPVPFREPQQFPVLQAWVRFQTAPPARFELALLRPGSHWYLSSGPTSRSPNSVALTRLRRMESRVAIRRPALRCLPHQLIYETCGFRCCRRCWLQRL